MVIKKRNSLVNVPRQLCGVIWVKYYLTTIPEMYREDLYRRIMFNRVPLSSTAVGVMSMFRWSSTHEDHTFWMYIHEGRFTEAYRELEHD